MYNVRGTKQELKEEMSNESTGTIEYAIKHLMCLLELAAIGYIIRRCLVINIYGEIILIRDIKWLI